jgi:hypothetical protein
VLAVCGHQLRFLSTQSEAAIGPETESEYHTIIKDTEKGTGELNSNCFSVSLLLQTLILCELLEMIQLSSKNQDCIIDTRCEKVQQK